MAADKRKINVHAVSFNSVALSHVQSVSLDHKGQTITGRGDNYVYPTHKGVIGLDPGVTIATQDMTTVQTFQGSIGTKSTLTWKYADAVDLTGTSDITVTIANAMLANVSRDAQHQQYGTATLTFETYSADGTTSPIVFS